MRQGNGSMLLAVSLILAGLSGLELALTPSSSPRPPAYLTDKLTQAGEEEGGMYPHLSEGWDDEPRSLLC